MNSSFRPNLLLLVLSLVALAGLLFINYRLSTSTPSASDFFWRWARSAGWVTRSVEPYAVVDHDQLARAVPDYVEPRGAGLTVPVFDLPLPSIVAYAPFGYVPFQAARASWTTLGMLGMAMAGLLGLRLSTRSLGWSDLLLVSLFPFVWASAVIDVVNLSELPLQIALIGGSLFAIHRQLDVPAGAALAAALLISPASLLPVSVLALIWGLSARRWWFALLPMGVVVIVSAALLALDPDWPIAWLQTAIPNLDITSLFTSLSIALLAYLIWEWIRTLGKPARSFAWTALATLAITTLLIRDGEATLLITPLFAVLGSMFSRWGARGRRAGWAALVAIAVGSWLALRSDPAALRGLEQLIAVLCLIGMWWMRWWSTRDSGLSEVG